MVWTSKKTYLQFRGTWGMFQKVLLEFFLDIVAGSEIRRFPVEVAILPLLAKVLAPSPGGWPGDF